MAGDFHRTGGPDVDDDHLLLDLGAVDPRARSYAEGSIPSPT